MRHPLSKHAQRLAWSLFALSLGGAAGCGAILIGDPVQELDVSAEDNAQKNLEAVRAMQAGRPPDGSAPPGPAESAPADGVPR